MGTFNFLLDRLPKIMQHVESSTFTTKSKAYLALANIPGETAAENAPETTTVPEQVTETTAPYEKAVVPYEKADDKSAVEDSSVVIEVLAVEEAGIGDKI